MCYPSNKNMEIIISQKHKMIIDEANYSKLTPFLGYFSIISGYAVINKKRNRKTSTFMVHRIITDCPKNKICHHKNRNKLDNRESNIEILTRREHALRHQQEDGVKRGSMINGSKLDEYKVKQIKKLIDIGFGIRNIAKKFGVVHSVISDINNGKSWVHVP
jgi:hypothetical protein